MAKRCDAAAALAELALPSLGLGEFSQA